ncbi:NrdH-redoxin [Pseudoclavibacter sp. AY1F1]|uniref:glutaredoxin family protein n=1 Tax=Pseudoclavibacter sp. AY1F1 TaxID=2080583 RepID=UPI000CE8FAF6|nr:glutaredoxin family protein [Pseudoclavibacter sp. AY1F1]PPF42864.1 NrdH-redoxin [Pseudoclavibacter sp. AY1F1]
MTDARVPKVTFLSKPGCHLCEEAEPVVREVTARHGAELSVLSILDDEALQQQYGELIPVVLVDGVQHSQWFVEAERLDAAIAAAASV